MSASAGASARAGVARLARPAAAGTARPGRAGPPREAFAASARGAVRVAEDVEEAFFTISKNILLIVKQIYGVNPQQPHAAAGFARRAAPT